MSERLFHCNAGDFILVDFHPTRGTEQDGKRPGLVISAAGMHEFSRRAFVCPITRNTQPWPTKVILPGGLVIRGAVLVDQMRSVDRAARFLRPLGVAPPSVLQEVQEVLAALLETSDPVDLTP